MPEEQTALELFTSIEKADVEKEIATPDNDVDLHIAELRRVFVEAKANVVSSIPQTHEEAFRMLNEYFVKWREFKLKASYVRNSRGNFGRPNLEKVEKYFTTAGEYDATYYYNRKGIPGNDFFRQEIYPTIMEIADTPEEVYQLGVEAIYMLEDLMVGELSYTTHSTNTHLIYGFFRNFDLDDNLYPRSRYSGKYYSREGTQRYNNSEAVAMFKYYYTNYGYWVTRCIARHQGWETDRHYDGGDYTNSKWEIDRKLDTATQDVPQEYMDDIFRIFYKRGGFNNGKGISSVIGREVKQFMEKGKEDLLPLYFELLFAQEKDLSWEQKSPTMGEVDVVIEQLEALNNMGVFREPAIVFAKADLEFEHSCLGFELSFIEGTLSNGLGINVAELIKKYKSAGKTDEEICEILQLSERFAPIWKQVSKMATHYLEIEENFPGGMSAFFEYLDSISSSPNCTRIFVQAVIENKFPTVNLETYLEVGKILVDRLGDDAQAYFNFSFVAVKNPNSVLLDLLNEPEKFTQVMLAAAEFAGAIRYKTGSDSPEQTIFDDFMQYFGDSHFFELMMGYKILIEGTNLVKEKWDFDKIPSRHRDESDLGRIFSQYARLKWSYRDAEEYMKSGEKTLPASMPYQELATCLLYIGTEIPRWEMSVEQKFSEYLRNGVKPGLALCLAYIQVDPENAIIPELEGIDFGMSGEKLRKVVNALAFSQQRLSELLHDNGKDPSIHLHWIKQYPDRHELDYGKFEGLAEQLQMLESLEDDPEIAAHIDIKPFKKTINEAMRFSLMQRMMGIAFNDNSSQVQTSDFFMETNSATKLAIMGMSLMLASKSKSIRGISEHLQNLPLPESTCLIRMNDPDAARGQLQLLVDNPKLEAIISENLKLVVPKVEEMVMRARVTTPGLMPVGGKIHTLGSMDNPMLEKLRKIFKLNSTAFRLIHADDSLLLPPLPSDLEEIFLIEFLEKVGIINRDKPELQVTMAGRWDESHAALVGSATILGSQRGVQYKRGAFETTHDHQTGARIMAFDAGVKAKNLPYDLANAKGRTDMLGRRHYGDISTYRLLGTLATHHQFDGPLAPFYSLFEREYTDILQRRGLDNAVHQSEWVFNGRNAEHGLDEHHRMVDAFTSAWFEGSEQPNFGVIGDVQQLIRGVHRRIQSLREKIIAENPQQFDFLKRY